MTLLASHRRRPRRGAILLVVIALTVITVCLTISLLQLVPMRMQTVRGELRQLQAEWLAESALERAAWRLRADPRYTGETWSPSPEELGLADGATVRIQVEKVPEHPNHRLVRASADYPNDPHYRVRRSKQITVAILQPNGKMTCTTGLRARRVKNRALSTGSEARRTSHG